METKLIYTAAKVITAFKWDGSYATLRDIRGHFGMDKGLKTFRRLHNAYLTIDLEETRNGELQLVCSIWHDTCKGAEKREIPVGSYIFLDEDGSLIITSNLDDYGLREMTEEEVVS